MTVHLCHQGRRLGAFSEEQVEAMLKAGVITDGTLAWTSGFAGWEPLREVVGPATPPPVPAPQTAAATTFGLTHECSSPTDDAPKRELPSPPSAPPVIAAPPIAAGLSEPVRQEILKQLKVGSGQRIAWFFFILGFAGGSAYGGTNALAGLMIFCCGPIVLRSWCKRCTLRLILRRDNLLHVYWPALWSFGWRNACVSAVVAFVMGCVRESAFEKCYTFEFILLCWFLVSLFALNIPRRYRRWVEWMIATNRAKTMPPTPSKNQDESGPVAVARGCPSSLRKFPLSTGSTKWVVGLSLVFAILSIIAVASMGIYFLTYRDLNRNAVETGGQDWPQSSNVVIALAQPPSGQTPAANSNLEPQPKRLGELFPSISQYGNPQYTVNWTNLDLTARNDDLFEFLDYPATTGFIAPPTDITVPVYPPGIGPVVKSVSPTIRIGLARDCVLYITDIRPGACVVWVGSTNADYAPELLCADHAVFAACEIADENDHEYKYLEICEGGAWRHSPSMGGSLVYFPVLFYKDRPATDARVQSVQEVRSRVSTDTVTLSDFLNAAAERAKHTANNAASP